MNHRQKGSNRCQTGGVVYSTPNISGMHWQPLNTLIYTMQPIGKAKGRPAIGRLGGEGDESGEGGEGAAWKGGRGGKAAIGVGSEGGGWWGW